MLVSSCSLLTTAQVCETLSLELHCGFWRFRCYCTCCVCFAANWFATLVSLFSNEGTWERLETYCSTFSTGARSGSDRPNPRVKEPVDPWAPFPAQTPTPARRAPTGTQVTLHPQRDHLRHGPDVINTSWHVTSYTALPSLKVTSSARPSKGRFISFILKPEFLLGTTHACPRTWPTLTQMSWVLSPMAGSFGHQLQDVFITLIIQVARHSSLTRG